MPPLASALLRTWWTPEFALASARVGLAEALATGCPLRVREWGAAVRWLEWVVGPTAREYLVPNLRQAIGSIVLSRRALARSQRGFAEDQLNGVKGPSGPPGSNVGLKRQKT